MKVQGGKWKVESEMRNVWCSRSDDSKVYHWYSRNSSPKHADEVSPIYEGNYP